MQDRSGAKLAKMDEGTQTGGGYGLGFKIPLDENLEDVVPILFFENAIDSSFEDFERTEIVE